jgi:putative hemolysin
MKERLVSVGLALIAGTMVITACTPATTATPTTYVPPSAPDESVGLANPASVYCEEQGYVLEMRTDENGTHGVCLFPDGSECEEWAYFRGECAPGELSLEEPSAGPVSNVAYEGITFSYDDTLASQVAPETVPAAELPMPGMGTLAQHIHFSFGGYPLPDTFHSPGIYVYPVTDLVAGWDYAATIVADLQAVLAQQSAEPGAVAILPPANAGQMIHTQASYADFQNGTGVRFLTQLAQAYYPINNQDLFYTYQGITQDGQYYVAAILPVSHPSLPPDGAEVPGDDWDAFIANFETYANGLAQQLDAEPSSGFTPDLALLDAMIASLEITMAP